MLNDYKAIPGLLQYSLIFFGVFGTYFFPMVSLTLYVIVYAMSAVLRAKTSVTSFVSLYKLWKTKHFAQDDSNSKPPADSLPYDLVLNAVVIPNYKEDEDLLRETLNALADQDIAKEKMIIVLAMEDREEGAEKKALTLCSEYNDKFFDIFYSMHPAGIPNELPGKAPNDAWALRCLKQKLSEMGVSIEHVLITIEDADTIFPAGYFSWITRRFVESPDRYTKFWEGSLSFFRNIYDVPCFTRSMEMFFMVEHLSWLSDYDRLFPLSSYSVSMKLLDDVGYWDVDIIDEDFHIFTKSVMTIGSHVHVEPVWLPVSLTVLESEGYLKTMVNRYRQAERHSMGAGTIGYILSQQQQRGVLHLDLLWRLISIHVLGPASVYLVFVGYPLWYFFNNEAKILQESHVAFYLLSLRDFCYLVHQFATVFIISAFVVLKWIVMEKFIGVHDVITWLFTPFAAPFYVVFPALSAQTKLLFTSSIEYYKACRPKTVVANLPSPSTQTFREKHIIVPHP
jgi:hypothetical protein